MNIEDVSNERLLIALEAFAKTETHTVTRMIELLIEVERRRLDLELSYTSMFDFCVRHLEMSENEAFRRLACARLAVKVPAVLDPLRQGKVTLTNIVLLRDHVTEDNVDALLAEIAGKTRKDVEAIVARLQPKPDVPDSIVTIGAQASLVTLASSEASDVGASTSSARTAAKPTASVRALSPERHVVTLTMSSEQLAKLEKARGLMHPPPKGDSLAAVVESALDLLIEKRERDKLGKTTRPRTAKPSKDPTYVSAATRREVAERDEMQCTYVSAEGVRCPARERLELDHRHPRARGGAGDATNVRLLCASHNRYEAEKAFGREHVERSIQMAQAKRRAARAVAAAASANHELSSKDEASPPSDPGDSIASKRACLRYALVKDLGFNSGEADRLIAAMAPAAWSRPLEALVVEALGRLAKGTAKHTSP